MGPKRKKIDEYGDRNDLKRIDMITPVVPGTGIPRENVNAVMERLQLTEVKV